MTKVKIEGTVYKVGKEESYGAKGFRKRLVVVEEDGGKFSEFHPVEFTNDLVDTSAGLSPGEHIVVDGFLTGRKWQKSPSDEEKFFGGVKAVSFSVNGQSVVKEPDATPAYAMDDLDSIPF